MGDGFKVNIKSLFQFSNFTNYTYIVTQNLFNSILVQEFIFLIPSLGEKREERREKRERERERSRFWL